VLLSGGRRGRRSLALLLGGAVLMVLVIRDPGTAGAGWGSDRSTWPVFWDGLGAVPRARTAGEQLEAARRARAAWRERGSPEEERKRVAAAFSCVAERFPGARGLAAESAFRAGELLRAGGFEGEAQAEWGRVLELAAGRGAGIPAPEPESASWAQRARLEIGHAARRDGTLDAALAAYEGVACDASAGPAVRDRAVDWTARTLSALGREEDARRWWRRLAEDGEDPMVRSRAYEFLARSWSMTGDARELELTARRAREGLEPWSRQHTDLGLRVATALRRIERLLIQGAERVGSVENERKSSKKKR
jgi:hypothetical protein